MLSQERLAEQLQEIRDGLAELATREADLQRREQRILKIEAALGNCSRSGRSPFSGSCTIACRAIRGGGLCHARPLTPLFRGGRMSGADVAGVPDDPVRGEDCQTVAVTITAQQCRMGRAALRLTQSRLASLAGITVLGLRDFELGGIRLHQNHRAALAAFLRAAGISFDGNKVEIAEKPQRGELQVRLMAPRGAVVHRGRTCPCNACVERRRLLELRRAARTVVDTVDRVATATLLRMLPLR